MMIDWLLGSLIVLRTGLVAYLDLDCFLLVFYYVIRFQYHLLFRLLTFSSLLGTQVGLLFKQRCLYL